MKFILKYLVDFGPLAVFFIFYKTSDKENSADKILEAVVPLIIATVIAVLVSYILEKKIPIMPTVGAVIVVIFGGLSWYFNNPVFIYYKPTIINLLFAASLIVGNFINQPLLKHLLGENIKLHNTIKSGLKKSDNNQKTNKNPQNYLKLTSKLHTL